MFRMVFLWSDIIVLPNELMAIKAKLPIVIVCFNAVASLCPNPILSHISILYAEHYILTQHFWVQNRTLKE